MAFETARELLSRVAQQQQDPERLRDLQQAVDELERARYAAEDRTDLARLETDPALPSALP